MPEISNQKLTLKCVGFFLYWPVGSREKPKIQNSDGERNTENKLKGRLIMKIQFLEEKGLTKEQVDNIKVVKPPEKYISIQVI